MRKLSIRTMAVAAIILLAYAGAGHAALGGPPAQFGSDSTTIEARVTSGTTSYTKLDTTLPTGTRVRQYVSGAGIVFAVSWDGPFLPDLQALLGKHFDTLVAESAKTPRAGSSQRAVNRPEVVIFSGGHMRAFEGRAWVPAELPAGFTANDIR
jgi:hypothetical protein